MPLFLSNDQRGESTNRDPKEREPEDINLDSREKRHIENYQCRDKLTLPYEKQVAGLDAKYGGLTKKRSESTAIYNCHGLSFGNRRTQITTNAALRIILEDDGYEEIKPDKVLPGDLILYHSPSGDIEHSGIVIEREKKNDVLAGPLIISKWGVGPEYIHHAHLCDYDKSNIKYYRLKPHVSK